MAVIRVEAERDITLPAEQVYCCIVDYTREHGRWLPPNYSGYTVEQGGEGDGTVFGYTLKVGNRERAYRLAVAVPEPGTVIVEKDTGSTLVNTWTLTPQGKSTHVRLRTEWEGHGGVGGFFERLFAPGALKRVYDDELARLDQYAVENAAVTRS